MNPCKCGGQAAVQTRCGRKDGDPVNPEVTESRIVCLACPAETEWVPHADRQQAADAWNAANPVAIQQLSGSITI